jgi:hypothetical protein
LGKYNRKVILADITYLGVELDIGGGLSDWLFEMLGRGFGKLIKLLFKVKLDLSEGGYVLLGAFVAAPILIFIVFCGYMAYKIFLME